MRTLHTPQEAARWLHEHVSGELCTDSRRVKAGDGFVAWPGAATDGRQHVSAALAQGASACLVEANGAQPFGFTQPQVVAYAQLKAASGEVASHFYGQPSHDLDVLAVTGTNGKTSSTWWLAQALAQVRGGGQPVCGLIGTLGVGVAPTGAQVAEPLAHLVPTGLTTPDPIVLQQQLRRFVEQGLTACAIEASSIGVVEHRLDGTRIRVALFTNFTQDHLDYHGSMDAYWQAKAALFDWPALTAAVINVDDVKGKELAQRLHGRPLELWTVGIEQPARLQAVDVGYDTQGMFFTVVQEQGSPASERHTLHTTLIGRYNVSNVLGVLGALRALGVPLRSAVQACTTLSAVPGRMDALTEPGQPVLVVDYAHTPDALDKALQALRPLTKQRAGQLWCVFGCGGDRDATKRPLMAAIAQRQADHVVLTSDNPRNEDPLTIIEQMHSGLGVGTSAMVQPDRAQAIAWTVQQAAANDVVLIAGKGHETTQEVAGVKHAFSDKAHATAALQHRRFA